MRSVALILSFVLTGCASTGADNVAERDSATVSTSESAAGQAAPERLIYRRLDNETLSAFVFEPDATEATDTAILLFHGGGYFTGSPQSTFMAANAFASAGITAISIQYRLADENNTPIEALSDACHALQWVRGDKRFNHIDDQKIALFGISAGAHLAANLVTHGCENPVAPPSALLLNSASVEVMSFADRFRSLLHDKAEPQAHSPLHNMISALPPTAMAHGEMDRLAPIPTVEEFCARQINLGGKCELMRFPARGHLMSRNLEQQIPGPGFDPDLSDLAESHDFFIRFLEENSG
ncbi:alpha/beta hydrolase [Aurantiacibacter rhizosphaerae]|uniref:Alpha/beta hydrolase fold domain-containing protein n=1 Tax=Aurantiacibacter rhizosphaerae TaxID=2691582 RepID=A0A844X9B4_9SPHN|nr:alpha/beta hydrolase [Aurantiacibacter rhizosphaerae]MWV26420.1 alpha/beta hydrolase fold domain-containing protein [Aurantiacibacter rhizosphaerae]